MFQLKKNLKSLINRLNNEVPYVPFNKFNINYFNNHTQNMAEGDNYIKNGDKLTCVNNYNLENIH